MAMGVTPMLWAKAAISLEEGRFNWNGISDSEEGEEETVDVTVGMDVRTST